MWHGGAGAMARKGMGGTEGMWWSILYRVVDGAVLVDRLADVEMEL